MSDFYRNIVPPLDSLYTIPKKFIGRKDYIIPLGTKLRLILNGKRHNEYHIAAKLMLDSYIDWSIYHNTSRKKHISSILHTYGYKSLSRKVLDNFKEPVIPQEYDWFSDLKTDDQNTLIDVFSYNDFAVSSDKRIDKMRIHDIGQKDCSLSFFDILYHTNHFLFLIRPTYAEYDSIRKTIKGKGIICGSFRRKKSTGHDIDILIKNEDLAWLVRKLEHNYETIKLSSSRYVVVINNIACQIDINTYDPKKDSLTLELFHHTGPKELVIAMSILANKNGYKLNHRVLLHKISNTEIIIKNEDELRLLLKVKEDSRIDKLMKDRRL